MKTKVFPSIRDVPKDQWNALLGKRSLAFSHEFWEVIERFAKNDFPCRYIMFFDDTGNPVALTSMYSITIDIAIFASRRLRGVLSRIRRVFPGFLKLRMLECGTPITLNSPPLVAAPSHAMDQIIPALDALLSSTASSEGQRLILVRDFESGSGAAQSAFTRLGYRWISGLPNTYMDIRWSSPEVYRASMQSYYRSKLLRHLRKNEAQKIRHELVDDFHDMADILCAQWTVVHRQADEYQREVLTPDFYREFSLRMGARSKVLLFYRENELTGHALLFVDGGMLRWMYFGRTDAVNDSLYIYAAHAVIGTAIRLGVSALELGLTTYSVKQDLGARIAPIKFALRSTWRFVNPLIDVIYPIINDPPSLRDKNIFKSDSASAP